MRATALGDLVLGLAGTAIAAALLVIDSALFDLHTADADILGAVFLLAATGQAAPMLGLAIAVRAVLLRATTAHGPRAYTDAGLPMSQNVLLIGLVAFLLAFLGVFALLYSVVFAPLIALAVIARFLYRPLTYGHAGARSVFHVLSFSAIGFGALCIALHALSRF